MLVVLATHPIQYQVPIWKLLAQRNRIPFEVWYLTGHGVRPSYDVEFGKTFQWDIDLLSGYPYRFPTVMPSRLGSFWQVSLNSEYRSMLESGNVNAVLLAGWNVRAYWEAILLSGRHGYKVWMRGDSHDLKVDHVFKRVIKHYLIGGLLRHVDQFLYVGQANRRLYLNYGVSEHRLFFGPHSVDNERFKCQASEFISQRPSLRSMWNIPSDAYCLLFIGKFIPEKAPEDMVSAVRKLTLQDPCRRYHLLFVGAGPLGDQLRSQCQVVFDSDGRHISTGLLTSENPKASFAGFLNQSEVSRAYVAADALVLPSVSETWGLVVNEAMASGLPCVVSEVCGAADDLVRSLDPRLCFPPRDINALADAIHYLADSPLPLSRLAERIGQYNFSVTVETLEQLWDDIEN